jgi:5-methylcytosine-specific restriction endonuclease McrA
MPYRPMHRCLDCPRLVRGNGRCPDCQRAYWHHRQQTRDPRPVALYNSPAWRALAHAVVDDAIACHWCGKTGVVLTADHIQPVASHPALALTPENVVPACRSCQTKRSWESGARGYQHDH